MLSASIPGDEIDLDTLDLRSAGRELGIPMHPTYIIVDLHAELAKLLSVPPHPASDRWQSARVKAVQLAPYRDGLLLAVKPGKDHWERASGRRRTGLRSRRNRDRWS